MRKPAFLALLLVLAGLPAVQAAAENPRTVPSTDAESVRLYQSGLDDYARGDSGAALASFRKALRLSPKNASALAAVHRLESEAAYRRLSAPRGHGGPAPATASRLERFLLVSVPRWFYFERTLGDGLRDVGTLTALNASVVQLLGERKVALAHNRPFRKERRLRELLRRAPAVMLGHGQG